MSNPLSMTYQANRGRSLTTSSTLLNDERRRVRIPKKIDEVLPLDCYRGLKPSTKRVYSYVWNSATWSQNPTWIDDGYIAGRCDITVQRLREVRDELAARGLLKVAPGNSGCLYTIRDPFQH